MTVTEAIMEVVYHRECGRPVLLTARRLSGGEFLRSGECFHLDGSPTEAGELIRHPDGDCGARPVTYVYADGLRR